MRLMVLLPPRHHGHGKERRRRRRLVYQIRLRGGLHSYVSDQQW